MVQTAMATTLATVGDRWKISMLIPRTNRPTATEMIDAPEYRMTFAIGTSARRFTRSISA
jgi:hypothetical protein